MKHVVSVSLGSSKRGTRVETELLGTRVLLERRAADGSLEKAAAMIRELDGEVDAIGLGGIDLLLKVGSRDFFLRDGLALARNARETPVVCGAGLKDSLEREVVAGLRDRLAGKRVLMLSAVDRYGMAEALEAVGAHVLYGDAVFLLGLPWPIRSLAALRRIATLALPVGTKLPISWLYPTGKAQEQGEPGWRGRFFDEAEVIAGDFHLLRRFAPARLDGKLVLTNTTTQGDVALMREKGVKTLVTTTPRYGGRSLSTNLLEAALVAVAERFPLSREDYTALIEEAELRPDVLELGA